MNNLIPDTHVYMAHPVRGDIDANLEAALRWLRWCHQTWPDWAVHCPWMAEVAAYRRANQDGTDENWASSIRRQRGLIRRMDAILTVGVRMTDGMTEEVAEARATPVWVLDLTHLGTSVPDGVVAGDVQRVVPPGGPTAFTIGNRAAYEKEMTRNPLARKLGASGGYKGGWVWRTEEETRQFVHLNKDQFSWIPGVFGLYLPTDWESDVSPEPHPSDGVHRLLHASLVVSLSGTGVRFPGDGDRTVRPTGVSASPRPDRACRTPG